MTRNQRGILFGIAFLAWAVIMGGWHWLLTGVNTDFGIGVAVGATLAAGILALLSRTVREIP